MRAAPVSWHTELLTELISQLTTFRPWNKSAVVRAMLQAAQDLEGAEGYRALVLLTDGEDNRWLRDLRPIPSILTWPRRSGTDLTSRVSRST